MTPGETDPRTALDHLQQAAVEVIAAARAVLDTLDGVIADPPWPGDILGRFGPLAESFFEWIGSAAGSGAAGPAPGRSENPGRKPVEHIPVR